MHAPYMSALALIHTAEAAMFDATEAVKALHEHVSSNVDAQSESAAGLTVSLTCWQNLSTLLKEQRNIATQWVMDAQANGLLPMSYDDLDLGEGE